MTTCIMNKNKNKNQLTTKNRKELQELCKTYGIKGNISSENMIKCIDIAMMNKNFKKSWFELHKDGILVAISIASLTISTISLFLFFKHSQ